MVEQTEEGIRKVVVNVCYGGFSLSREGVLLARELSGDPKWGGPTIKGDVYPPTEREPEETPVDRDFGYLDDITRDNPILVEVVERLGVKANGSCAELRVVEIPDDINWEIEEYDGKEWISEEHRTW